MYLLNEEWHGTIAVVNNTFKTVNWLLDNGWLDVNSNGSDGEKEFKLWEIIGSTKEELKEKQYLINNYFNSMNLGMLFEQLEMFGFYFQEIEEIK